MTKPLTLLLLITIATTMVGAERLTNDDILRLTQAKLSTDLIITAIKNAEPAFDTGTQALISLRKAGVANEALLAMLRTTSSARPDATGDPRVVRFEFVGVLYRLTTMRSVNGILRGYDDRLVYEPTKEAWQEHALDLPWSSIKSMCFEEGPIRGDLYLTVAGREDPVRLSMDPDEIQPMRKRIEDLTQRSIVACE